MKKGDHISDEQKAAMKAGRERATFKRAAGKLSTMFCFNPPTKKVRAVKESHPIIVAKVDAGNVAVEAASRPGSVEILSANGYANVLDIADPVKWQMKIRLFLEASDAETAEHWMEGIRLIMQMAGAVVRDSVYRRVTNRCYICDKPFTDGKPAGEAGYFDADRQYIKVYCCHNAEYSQLLMKCQEKEQAVAAWVEKAEKAARQAMIDARSAARRTMPA